MTLEEYDDLKMRVGWGEEIIIRFRGIDFWISQNSKGVYLTRNTDGFYRSFSDSEQLFQEATIDGMNIKDIWSELA